MLFLEQDKTIQYICKSRYLLIGKCEYNQNMLFSTSNIKIIYIVYWSELEIGKHKNTHIRSVPSVINKFCSVYTK